MSTQAMSTASQQHVVFMNIAATGHMNPTLPLVAKLKQRGCTVTYFVGESMRDVVESAGAQWRSLRYPHGNATGTLFDLDAEGIAKYVPVGTPESEYRSLPNCLVYNAELVLPALIQDLEKLTPAPSMIVYDPFLAFPRVAAFVLGVPAISILTFPGPGCIPKNALQIKECESKPWVRGPQQVIKERYGVDVLTDNLQMEFFSPTLNLVTTIDEMFVPPTLLEQKSRYGHFPFKCVGALVDEQVKRVANAYVDIGSSPEADRLADRLDGAKDAGKTVVYLSMGTIATSRYWTRPFGEFGKENGVDACTGKQLIQHVFRSCFEAMGSDDSLCVLMSIGPNDDAFDDIPALPENFIARKSVPQLEVLSRCDVFITHGGANSIHEGLKYGVPMVVIPCFGDQPDNAESIAGCGAGVSFRRPLSSLSAESLRHAIVKMTTTDLTTGANGFRLAAQKMSEKLALAGGVEAAVSSLLEEAVQLRNIAKQGGA